MVFGAYFHNMGYALPLSDCFKQFHITQLEMLNIVEALKIWAPCWQNKIYIYIYCDNTAVVEVIR